MHKTKGEKILTKEKEKIYIIQSCLNKNKNPKRSNKYTCADKNP